MPGKRTLAAAAAEWEKETGLSLLEWIERDLANRRPQARPRAAKKGRK
jgi:hypothetical protein